MTAPAGSEGGERVEQAGQSRFARVEALRAICCLGVVVGHVWGYSQDWNYELIYGDFWSRSVFALGLVGVPTFFAASGYLLYLPFARRDFSGGGRVDVRQYLLNRARRIFPLYYVSLLVVFLFWTEGGGTFEQWWKFALFLQNFSTETEGTVNGVLWSLVVDLQFYALLPLIALGIARVARGRMRVAVYLLVGAAVLSCIAFIAGQIAWRGLDRRLWQHNLPACFSFLAAGMLLALLRVHLQRFPDPRLLRGRLGNADVWLLAAAGIVALTVWDFDLHFLNAASAFLVLGATALPLRRGRAVGLLDWRPLAVVGVATFSIYIWHGPIIRGLTNDPWMPTSFLGELLVVTPIAVLVGLASYQLIEKPFLSRRRTWSPGTAATSPDRRPDAAEPSAASESAPAPAQA